MLDRKRMNERLCIDADWWEKRKEKAGKDDTRSKIRKKDKVQTWRQMAEGQKPSGMESRETHWKTTQSSCRPTANPLLVSLCSPYCGQLVDPSRQQTPYL